MALREITRPDPEELLRQFEAQLAHEARGRLKLFLGYASRVGKSRRMFDEGRRRRKRGQDVVIGAIQSRGREAVADSIQELEIIPPLGAGEAEAIDVAAVVRRAPQVCLVDELARDYAPGSPYAHRWQEVEAIREQGINVVAAVNLQHIAEQQDAVELITNTRSSSSVPQRFIHSADEIVIVDVPAEEILQHGGTARLSPEQLSRLRELALPLAAQVIEQRLQCYMDAHGLRQSRGTQERVLVCIPTRSSARHMLESGARAAARFHGRLLVLYVRQRELPRDAGETMNESLAFARKLGAEVHVIDGAAGENPINAIMHFAREQRITQLFIGHTRKTAWKFWASNSVDKLIREAEGMDVRIFPNVPGRKPAAHAA